MRIRRLHGTAPLNVGHGSAYRVQGQTETGVWTDVGPWIDGPQAAAEIVTKMRAGAIPGRLLKGLGNGVWRVIDTW